MGIVLYVIASGFVLAGLLNAIHNYAQTSYKMSADLISDYDEQYSENSRVQTSEHAPEHTFALKFRTLPETIWSITMCFLAGPYLVLIQSYRYWQKQHIPSSAFSICVLISIMWSFCTGVFIVEVGLLIGIISL